MKQLLLTRSEIKRSGPAYGMETGAIKVFGNYPQISHNPVRDDKRPWSFRVHESLNLSFRAREESMFALVRAGLPTEHGKLTEGLNHATIGDLKGTCRVRPVAAA